MTDVPGPRMGRIEHRQLLRWIPLAVFVLSLSVYLRTCCPTVGFIDSGELTAVSHTLGIAHPTGYPLYTILGRLFTLIPLGEVAWRLNLASSLFVACSAALLSLTLISFGDWIAGVTVPSLFAFSPVLWSQAIQAEVYSLTVLLSAVLLWLVLNGSGGARGTLLFCFVFGLSLTNHMSVLALALPVTGYLVLTRRAFLRGRLLLASVLLFILGLSLYLYLGVRSAQGPTFNWGDPRDPIHFLRHVSGKQYRVWMFASSLSVLKAQVWRFLRLLMQQFTPFLIPFSILGVWRVFRRRMGLGGVLLSIFLLDLVYINYDIPDLEPYFLPAFMVAAIWTGIGLAAAASLLAKRVSSRSHLAALCSAGAIVLALVPLAVHYDGLDRSRDYAAYDYGVDILRSIGRGGICITNNWDIYSPILYLKYVQGVRQDAVLIDKELLRRTWYLEHLSAEYPWLMDRSEREVGSYLELLRDFEEGELENPREIQRRFIDMINSFISRNSPERGVFTTFVDGFDADAPDIGRGYSKIPHGLVYWVGADPGPPRFDYGSLSGRGRLNPSVPQGDRRRLNLNTYPRMLAERARYEMRLAGFSRAASLLSLGLEWDWEPILFHGNLGMCYFRMGDYERASKEFAQVLSIDPKNQRAKRALAAIEDMLRRQ